MFCLCREECRSVRDKYESLLNQLGRAVRGKVDRAEVFLCIGICQGQSHRKGVGVGLLRSFSLTLGYFYAFWGIYNGNGFI